MRNLCHHLVVWGLFSCCFLIPASLSAGSGCTTGQLQGAYVAQTTNTGFQGALALPPTTAGASVVGFASNPNSLSGSLPGLGRYYLDGTGNIVGLSAASSTSPAVNMNLGTYTVNVDCTASVKLTSGAAYDLYLAADGTTALYVRTDSAGGGESGVMKRAGSCVTLNYPGTYAFAASGATKQTPASGTSGVFPYSAAGVLNLSGLGTFTMSESLYNASGVQRSTATGTYTVGADCSVALSFSTTTGANSTNFVMPTSFRFLMVDATSGLLSLQPDSSNTIGGSVTAQ